MSIAGISHGKASRWVAAMLDRYRWVFFGLLAGLYIAGFNGKWLAEPDSALYLTLGRNLSLGRGYTYHGVPHELAYPGLPVALAGVFRCFGKHAIAAADGLMILCGLAAIACTYRLILLAYDRATGVVVAMGLGISHEFYRYCYEIMTDVPFCMGVFAFLAGYQGVCHAKPSGKGAGWWDWALLGGGLVVLMSTRPTMWGLVAAWMAAMVWTVVRGGAGRKPACIMLGVALVAGAAFFALEEPSSGGHIGDYERHAVGMVTNPVEEHLGREALSNVKDLIGQTAARSIFGMPLGRWWLNAIFAGIPLVVGLALIRKELLWGLWVAMTLAMMIVLMSHDRYLLQIMPLLLLAWWKVIYWVNQRVVGLAGEVIFVILLLLGTALNIGKIGEAIRDQHRRPFMAHYKDGELIGYEAMARQISANAEMQEVVISPPKLSRILTFWSDRRVVEEGEADGLTPGGRILVVIDPANGEYLNWLRSQDVIMDVKPLASIARNGKPPLELVAGKLK